MQIGIVGLGRMGMNMARRLLQGGHEVVAWNRTIERVHQMEGEGARRSESPEDLVGMLTPPRCVWLMLPAGQVVDQHVQLFAGLLQPGDIIVDGSNGRYQDDVRRSRELGRSGIHYIDAGVSGGIWGLREGYCLMLGGQPEVCDAIRPLLETLAPSEGYLYCGPAGAGHFTKMVHNGIEYALMQAYAEGFAILNQSPYAESVQFQALARLWNHGSVIRSWLLELLERAFGDMPSFEQLVPYVEDSGEGRWTVQEAIAQGVPVPVIAASLFERFASRGGADFSGRVLAALRNQFGGHAVRSAGAPAAGGTAGGIGHKSEHAPD